MKITYEALVVEDENTAVACEVFEELVKVFYPEYIKRDFK